MTTLEHILLSEGIEYKPGDIIVGITKHSNHRIYMSDEVSGHYELSQKYGNLRGGTDDESQTTWRYNKVTQELFFWRTSMPVGIKESTVVALKNDGFIVNTVKNIHSYISGSFEQKHALYHSHGGDTFYDPDKEPVAESTLNEVPVDVFQTIGDFDKGASFRDKRDRDIIKHPVTVTKVKDFFKNTSVDFDFYFVNLPGRRKWAETGVVKPEILFKPHQPGYARSIGMGIKPEQLKNGEIDSNKITVFFVGNTAAEKTPMTAWTIAHRFGHVIRREYAFEEYGKWLDSQFASLLSEYRINPPPDGGFGLFSNGRVNFDKAKAQLFNQIGTMKSARDGKIVRHFEFYYELFAQYLKNGEVTFNPLKRSIRQKYGAYGREEMAYTNDVESANDILDSIKRDFPYYAGDVLSDCVGKVYVM